METRNDFDRELERLQNMVKNLPSMGNGQQMRQETKNFEQQVEQSAKKFEQTIEQGAKKIGQTIQQSAKKFAEQMQAPPKQNNRMTNYRTAGYNPPPPHTAPRSNPQTYYNPAQPQPNRPQNMSVPVKRYKIPGKNSGIVLQVFGWLGGIPSAIISLVCGITGKVMLDGAGVIAVSGFFGVVALAFGAMILGGRKLSDRAQRCINYRKLFGTNKMLNLETLSQQTGRSKKYLIHDIRVMVRRGMLSNIYFDAGQTCVILDDETYQQYRQLENRRKNMESSQEEATRLNTQNDSQLSKLPSEAQKYISQIRAANDALPSKEISDKLYRLENITIKIYEHIEKHPEKLDQVQRFMDYYMPTTTKLVKAYEEFEAQPVQGANIQGAKQEIDEMLNTICDAFENMLDGLFADSALDISADISVMETMFRQDGLTKDEISNPKE